MMNEIDKTFFLEYADFAAKGQHQFLANMMRIVLHADIFCKCVSIALHRHTNERNGNKNLAKLYDEVSEEIENFKKEFADTAIFCLRQFARFVDDTPFPGVLFANPAELAVRQIEADKFMAETYKKELDDEQS